MAKRLLDSVMPAWDVRDGHQIRIAASPERVDQAINEVTVADVPLMTALLSLRALPARLAGRRLQAPAANQRLMDLTLERGFTLLAERPGQQRVVGAIAQFWILRGGKGVRVSDASAFQQFCTPGFAKAAMDFVVAGVGTTTLLMTETRVTATDAATRRTFRRYWRVIYPGSALIRWALLRTIKRRAERAQHSAAAPVGAG